MITAEGILKIFTNICYLLHLEIFTPVTLLSGMLRGENDIWGEKITKVNSVKTLVSDCRTLLLAFVQLEKEF